MDSENVVVVGSCMMDFVSYAPRLPLEGETIFGSRFDTNFGGKGANQCVAAAKLGAKASLVARVGDDVWGEKYIENLKDQRINTDHVRKTPNTANGIAQITVSDNGQNQIVIVPGANEKLSVNDVLQAKDLISTAAVLVLQLETSVEVAVKALELCQGFSVLNGAPALAKYNPKLLTLPSLFCVNETEAATFSGLPVNNLKEAEVAAKALIAKGAKKVIITLGAEGAVYVDEALNVDVIPAEKVECVDSTGAGDAFIGALAYLVAHYKKAKLTGLVSVACKIASQSVTKPGTQISFSTADGAKQYLKDIH